MKKQYAPEQLERIRDQTAVYQCACPAQVCKAIEQIRYLNNYQKECMSKTDSQQEVHEAISAAA